MQKVFLMVFRLSLVSFAYLFAFSVTSSYAQEDPPIGRHYQNMIILAPLFDDSGILHDKEWEAVADINGDGLDDLVVLEMHPDDSGSHTQPIRKGHLYILTRNDAGLLVNSSEDLIEDSAQLLFDYGIFYFADFNGDGKLDIFVDEVGQELPDNQAPGSQNRLLISSDDGKLHEVTATHLPQRLDMAGGSCAADFDGDSDVDIWITSVGDMEGRAKDRINYSAPFHYLMFNDGEGRFSVVADFGGKSNMPLAIGPQGRLPEDSTYRAVWCSAVDAEGDGDVDIVLGYSQITEACEYDVMNDDYDDGCGPAGDYKNVILINDGSGHFSEGHAWSGHEPRWQDIEREAFTHYGIVGDVNADGLDDPLRYLTVGEEWETTILQILISNGDGTFRDESDTRYGEVLGGLSRYQLHDLDGDGHKDLFSHLWRISDGGIVDIRINDGEGYFRRLADDWVSFNSNQWVVLDVDGDGGTDFWIQHGDHTELHKMNLPYGAVLDGTSEDDRLIGGAHDNVYRGLAGNDVLDGGLGDDDLDGGEGDDELIGGKGDEWLKPGPGSNTVDGGPGRDLVEYALAMDEVEILLDETTFISTGNKSVNDEVQNTEYAVFTDAATPLPTNQQSAIASLNGVAGLWYDPDLDGEGFNVITAPTGTVLFFYGYTANGQRLWLISETFSNGIAFDQVLDLQMFEAQGGTFDQPAPSSEALSEWGRLKGLFDACGTGRFALHGNDGVKTTYQIKLAGITDGNCTTETLSAPSGLAGLWYDPLLDGEGYNLIITNTSTVFFFYGYDTNGQRLWLISETMADAPLVGQNVQLTMFSASGGTFDEPAPSSESLSDWGTLDITFNSCGDAIANLNGTDGEKTSSLTKLAGIENATCP
jgi:hypothetical protein